MLYSIENEKIKVTVSDMGAEMTSLILKETGVEYLWQADPTYWGGHAYNLFPICGRLWEGKYTYKGNSYEMKLHGFARNSLYTLINKTENSLSFLLTDNEETLKQYPFHFELILTYSIDGNSVKTSFVVNNKDEKDLIFAVGGHPGFNVPLEAGEKFADYTMTFSEKCKPEVLCLSERCFYLGKNAPFELDNDISFNLTHSLFDNDAIFLTNVANEVTMQSKISKRYVKVSYPNMKYLGFWHTPLVEAPFVCIEPWTSYPAIDGNVDDFETKGEMLRLKPENTFEQSFTISIG